MTNTQAAKLLRQIQAINGFTQSDMAMNLGVTERTFRTWLQAPGKMSAEVWWKVERMANKLGLIKE